MRQLFIVLAFAGCSHKGLVAAAHAPRADSRPLHSNSERALPTAEPDHGEPARIGPPLGNGAGSRRISTRDDAPTFGQSERLAGMDSASSLSRE
jgi:hypothetical protein